MQSEAGLGAYPKNLNRQIHGLRGFAALAVFVYHVYGMGRLWNFWPARLDPLAPVFEAGKHGVEIFFIISGYLITGSLIRHGSAAKFLIDRTIRIYPVFLTIQLIVFGLGPFIHYRWLADIGFGDWVIAFLENGLFLPGIFDLPLAQQNAWSLSFEAAFYLISAACFVLVRYVGRWPVIVGVALFLAYFLSIDGRAVYFLPGVATFFIVRHSDVRLPPWFRALSIPGLLLTLGIITLSETLKGPTVFFGAVPGLIFFLCVVEGRCLLSAILRAPALQYLGTISYSFYLWSPVVTYPMKLVIQRFLHGWVDDLINIGLFATVGFAASLVVARISYRLLEDGMGRRLHRGAGGRGAAARSH